MEDVEIRRRIFLPLFELEKILNEFNTTKSLLHLTYWEGPNRRDKVLWSLKGCKFIFLATFSLPSSSPLLKVPNNLLRLQLKQRGGNSWIELFERVGKPVIQVFKRRLTRWLVAMAFPPATFKTELFRPRTDVECNDFIESWQGSSWMNYVQLPVFH